ncbi:Crp/Fnr family transcriptional regulator [Mucilaginibacter paludis]|uniref:Transcriptional regulator, Crp/Fnr family n=1 Tax=Mucilaginibacter paludis DSM 18603 TaxID=714943 RepID=H1Y069_9SPHI|nr:Crp/Fnr family transcriptional regulator [Mucilaginibacter paludis]EHQ27978.1 putative transcriptional regulator, Crp/Fnr family [Mucilaginibacter paludis DSM 18603]
MQGIEEILRRQIEKIVELTDDEFHFILSHFTIKSFKKHQYVVQAGNPTLNDHFVVKGLLRSFYLDEAGKSHILQFAMEDWWISDPQAYHNGGNATLNIDCLEDTQVYMITLENREKLCAELRKMEFFFRKKTQAGYIALQKRIQSLMSQTAKERYDQFLHLYPQLSQRVPKTLIASYLGISRETLSRMAEH